jgi:hypothetical protein
MVDLWETITCWPVLLSILGIRKHLWIKTSLSFFLQEAYIDLALAVLNGCFWQFEISYARVQVSFPPLKSASTPLRYTQSLKDLKRWLQGKQVVQTTSQLAQVEATTDKGAVGQQPYMERHVVC